MNTPSAFSIGVYLVFALFFTIMSGFYYFAPPAYLNSGDAIFPALMAVVAVLTAYKLKSENSK